MLGGRTIGILAVIAIAGMTGAVGVLVSWPTTASSPPVVPVSIETPRPRPQLTSTDDVRTMALHRVHLQATQRIDCADCHDLRANDFRAPSGEKCLGCHANHEPLIHAAATEARTCVTCHDFLSPKPAKWAEACTSCHAKPQGTRPAIASHREQDCVQCHGVHGRREVADCLRCHDEQATAHVAGRSGFAACQSCHPPHTPARTALARCAGCHVDGASKLVEKAQIPATALFRGHDRCVQCHVGHSFTRDTARTCRDCHQTKQVSPAHTACTACHDPHAPLAKPPAAKCASCHRAKQVLASAMVPSHAACTSCHDPHAPPPANPTARCTTCHREVAAATKHPGRDCVGCHPPHEPFAPRIALACTERCHAEKRAPGVGHGTARCGDCHTRHRFTLAAPEPAFCLGCHAKPTGHAPAIATSTGHARCTNCHTSSHRPAAPRPACATCHAPQASTAPPGHADCKKCHDVHTGNRLLTAARCESCHADRTRTPHVRVPGGCNACHRPHGPKGVATLPACAQCHTNLPGLHGGAKHQRCSDCHRAHSTEIDDRETCVRCHTDRRDHVPDAKRCQACHPFGGTR